MMRWPGVFSMAKRQQPPSNRNEKMIENLFTTLDCFQQMKYALLKE
jgi:hypothetical protein